MSRHLSDPIDEAHEMSIVATREIRRHHRRLRRQVWQWEPRPMPNGCCWTSIMMRAGRQ